MVTYYILGDDGEAIPATLEQWGTTGPADRAVRRDHIGSILVSTALTGIDYGTGPWETMIFDNGEPVSRRPAHTKADALAYHQDAVAILKADAN